MPDLRRLCVKPTVRVFKTAGRLYLYTCGQATEIDDPTGFISDVVGYLNGNHTVSEIVSAFSSVGEDAATTRIHDIIQAFDDCFFLDDLSMDIPSVLDTYDLERWSRNFDFLGSYCKQNESKYQKQALIKNARVALLGLGGLGSHILYDLVAFGFSDIRAVDFDRLELANLNRQILYSEPDIGRLKTELAAARIREFAPKANVVFVNKRLGSASDIAEIVSDMDAVICVADKPRFSIARWLNEACVKADVPFINGGIDNQRAVYYTVLPYSTGCVECWKLRVESTDALSTALLADQAADEERGLYSHPAPAVVPLVSTLTGFMVSELVRIVTNIVPPVATNRLRAVDFTTMQVADAETWERRLDCPLCGSDRTHSSRPNQRSEAVTHHLASETVS
jgi:molybdopterin/thiamine biosynthesis adenylyltransferase